MKKLLLLLVALFPLLCFAQGITDEITYSKVVSGTASGYDSRSYSTDCAKYLIFNNGIGSVTSNNPAVLQFNSTKGGFVVNENKGKRIQKIELVWHTTKSTTNRTIKIYKSDTAYSSAAKDDLDKLKDTDKVTELAGKYSASSPSVSYEFEEGSEPKYIAFTVSGATYFESINITWVDEKKVLGDLTYTVSDGQSFENEELGIELGTTITFGAENADLIEILDENNDQVVSSQYELDRSVLTWTPEKTSEDGAYFTAKAIQYEEDGVTVKASKEMAFLLTVTTIEMGTPVITYVQDGKDVEVYVAQAVTVDEGTKFTFSCENAEKMVVYCDNEEVARNDEGSTVEWYPGVYESNTMVTLLASRTGLPDMSFTFYITSNEIKLGEIEGMYESGDNIVEISANNRAYMYEGTTILFTCDNATQMTVKLGETVLATAEGSSVDWTSTEIEGEKVTVEASRGDKVATPLEFWLYSRPPFMELGNIKATYRQNDYDYPVVANGQIKVVEDTEFTFTCENARKIVLSDVHGHIYAEGPSPLTWTASEEIMSNHDMNVTASRGVQDPVTLDFHLTVTEDPAKALGAVVGAYGDGQVVDANHTNIVVEQGTTITFSSANAERMVLYTSPDNQLVADEEAASLTWTATEIGEDIQLHVRSYRKNQTVTKYLNVTLAVTEPYVEPVNPNAEYVYKLVTNQTEIESGKEYVICAYKTDRAMTAQTDYNRQSEEVTIENNEIWNLSENVQIVKLVNSDVVEGSFDMEVGETEDGTPQYLYAAGNPSANKNQNYLKTATSTGESSAAKISVDADNMVKIDFSKASGKQGRYMQYNGTGKSTVFACYVSEHSENGYEFMRLFKKTELPGMPEYDEYGEDETKIAIRIIKGQLHVLVTEYDVDGNEVAEDNLNMTSAKASYVSEPTWTNPVVTDRNGMYVISLPEKTGNYIKVQAKNELNGYHSDELVMHVDASGGVLSGVEMVVAEDEEAEVEYFNLQGMKVEAGQPGIYVRRQGNKVSKVVVR